MSTGSDLVVVLAWRSAEIAAFGAALMLAGALIVRRYMQHEERARARVVAVWRPLLTQIALEEGELPSLPRLAPRRLPFLMEEWNALHDTLRGGASVRLNELARSMGLDAAARHMMHSREIRKRILAIRTLGQLRDAAAWKQLQEQLVAANALVSFYAAAALIQIDAQRAMPGIMLQLAERENWPGEAMARLLLEAGADVAREPIRALMLSLEPAKIPPLLPWLGKVDSILAGEVAAVLLHRHSSHEDVVAAALLVVQDEALLPELRPLAGSPNAETRKHLAVALGRLGGAEETELLIQLMGDPVWWVRYHAAHALLRLLGLDDAKLDAVRSRLTDRFAGDMLDHVRAEESVA
ncbi:MAG TPA: HEAT repeat domain-containing protein [Steroidobacteraceae bacterium]